jgi:hypothetical protein
MLAKIAVSLADFREVKDSKMEVDCIKVRRMVRSAGRYPEEGKKL